MCSEEFPEIAICGQSRGQLPGELSDGHADRKGRGNKKRDEINDLLCVHQFLVKTP